jgi:hypothetical protein
MNPQSYVQTQCPRCGAQAWGHPSMSVACGACGNSIGPVGAQAPMAAPMPAASAAPAAQAQPAQQQHKVHVNIGGIKIPFKIKGGAGMQFKIIGFVIFAIIASVAAFVIKSKFKGDTTAKGNLSYKSLGLNSKAAPVDDLVDAVERAATRWRRDAVWWSMNLQTVKADGTVDTNKAGIEVVYISPSGVSDSVKSRRDDSIKKFNFGPSGVSHDQLWGATEPWTDVYPMPTPKCGVKELMEQQLSKRGITGDTTVRISIDPDDYGAWHVWGDINAYFSPEDCSELKKQ